MLIRAEITSILNPYVTTRTIYTTKSGLIEDLKNNGHFRLKSLDRLPHYTQTDR